MKASELRIGNRFMDKFSGVIFPVLEILRGNAV